MAEPRNRHRSVDQHLGARSCRPGLAGGVCRDADAVRQRKQLEHFEQGRGENLGREKVAGGEHDQERDVEFPADPARYRGEHFDIDTLRGSAEHRYT